VVFFSITHLRAVQFRQTGRKRTFQCSLYYAVPI